MKTWARERFGVEVGYHEGKRGAAANSAALKDAQDYANYRGVPMDRLFRLLDLEYEFHQYTLRLLHRWDRFKVARYYG